MVADSYYIYGKVGVDISPVTRGFRRELQKRLSIETNGFDFEVPVIPDIDRAAYRVQAERLERDPLHVTAKVDFDKKQVQERMKRLGGKELNSVNVPLSFDEKQIRRDVLRTSRQLEDVLGDAVGDGFKAGTADGYKALKVLKARIENEKFDIEADVDISEAQYQLERLKENIDFAHRFDTQADIIEARLKRLSRSMPDIKMDADISDAMAKYRELSALIRNNERIDIKARMEAELDMGKARRKLNKFEREHNELKMDLDLETALARAHMAYFTRPRTVDIFARFRGSDFGKILNGIVNGSTGIKGVQDKFDMLVNTMDSLDKVIPKWSMLGSILISAGAGATNLATSIGGVGASLVTLSKASLAAPAALIGLGSAFYVLKAAIGDKGETISEELKADGTAFEKFADTVSTSFYTKVKPAWRDMLKDIGDTVVPGMKGMADAESEVAVGLMSMIRQANKAGMVANTFKNTNEAMLALKPGISDLTNAFFSLGDSSSKYLPRVSRYVSDVASRMAEWTNQACATGQIQASIDRAIEQGSYLKRTLSGLSGIVKGTFGTLAEQENGIQGFAEAVERVNRAVNSLKFQQTLRELQSGAQAAQDTVRDSFGAIGTQVWSLRGVFRQAFEDAGRVVASTVRGVGKLLAASGSGMRDFTKGIADGWQRAMSAIGDAGPQFSSLLSSVGSLSRTFGGTFASGLRVTAPLLVAIAKSAEAVATVFDKLPEPLKQAVVLYATFGRAGRSAMDALKMGVLENIEKMAQYRKTLAEVGVATSGAGMKFRELAAAWANAKFGEGNKFSTFIAGTQKATQATQSMTTATGLAGAALGALPTLGVTLGLSALTMAIGEWMSAAEQTRQQTQNLSDAMRDMQGVADSTAKGMSNIRQTIKDTFEAGDIGEGWWHWFDDFSKGLKDVTEASKITGISVGDLTKAVADGGNATARMLKKMSDEREKYANILKHANSVSGEEYNHATRMVDALDKQINALKASRSELRSAAETMAAANGYTKEYADALADSELSAEGLAASLVSAEDKTAMLAQAQQTAKKMSDDYRKAQRDLLDAQERYGRSTDGLQDKISKVQQLVQSGQQVWDSQAQGIQGVSGSFDMMSEAGRTAYDTLNTVGDSSERLIESMVDSGAKIEDVKAKQAELAESFRKTAEGMGVPKEAAEKLLEQYGLVPSNVDTLFTAHVEESKQALRQYLSQLRVLFPGANNDAVFTTVLKAIDDGTVKTAEDVYQKVQDTIAHENDGDEIAIRIGAIDEASNQAQLIYQELKDKTDNLSISLLVSAEDDASVKLMDVKGVAEALLDKKDIDLVLKSTDLASKDLDSVREKLRDMHLNDRQIDFILRAINQTPDVFEKVEADKQTVNKPASFIIDADNAPARGKFDEANSWQLSTKTAVMDGNNAPLAANFNQANSWQFATKTALMVGNNSDVRGKMNAVQAFNHTPFAYPKASIVADTSSYHRKVDSLNGSTVGSVFMNVVATATSGVKGLLGRFGIHFATGGRVFGPGTETSDSIPALLSNREMVIRAASVRRMDALYGSGTLDYINKFGKLPDGFVAPTAHRVKYQYADGGRVVANKLASQAASNSFDNRVVNLTINGNQVASDAQLRSIVGGIFEYAQRIQRMG